MRKVGWFSKKQKVKVKKELNTACWLFSVFKEVKGIEIEQSTPQDPKSLSCVIWRLKHFL